MRFLLALAFSLLLAGPAFAAFEGPGAAPLSPGTGTQEGAALCSAAAVLKAWDDTRCTVEGRLVEKVAGSKDMYVFEDSTGTILVDIDPGKFADRVVTPQNTVRLHGEVDVKHSGERELDVDVLEIIQ
ncbi:MAG: NirD/YgiW/YdeI family stress tolerance protein [Desulfovibrionaceae bacterium]|nr:NirD/YgiW/YdeI family stress tolerance protein [Desulfovibrionaceae bacterium]